MGKKRTAQEIEHAEEVEVDEELEAEIRALKQIKREEEEKEESKPISSHYNSDVSILFSTLFLKLISWCFRLYDAVLKGGSYRS